MKRSNQYGQQQVQQQGQQPQTQTGEGLGQGEGEKTPQAPEQAAELRALTAAAQGEDLGPAPGEEPKAPGVPLDQEIAGLLAGVVAIVTPALPSLKGIYTPEVVAAVSASVAAVCQKHGWLQSGVMGQYSEEIGCAFVVLPLAFVTYQAVSADLAQMAAKKASEQAAVPQSIPGTVDRAVVQGDAAA